MGAAVWLFGRFVGWVSAGEGGRWESRRRVARNPPAELLRGESVGYGAIAREDGRKRPDGARLTHPTDGGLVVWSFRRVG
jgi:hypothetical protein